MPFVSLPVLVVQQILCSTMSVFWGLGIGCMIDFFQNDIDKLVHAFYPLFKTSEGLLQPQEIVGHVDFHPQVYL